MNKLNIIYKDIDSIKEYENNPRFNDNAVEVVAESIKQFGFKVPAVIDKNGIIVSGHTRKKAAKLLGLKEIPCIIADDLTEEQLKAFRLADNKTAEFAEWDFTKLEEELKLIQNIDMSAFDFEVDFEVENVDEDNFDVEEAIEEIVEPKSKLGDIYQLGNHRLMCGDSTQKEDVEKLMNGNKADMVFTDPPYRMQVEGGSQQWVGRSAAKLGESIKDLCNFNPKEFLETLPNCFEKNKMNSYVFCNKDLVPDYLNWAVENKFSFNILFWKKPNALPLGEQHRPDLEYLLFFRKNAIWNNGLSNVSYSKCLEFGRENSTPHPTMKPIGLITNEIQISSNVNSRVLDLFGGSGSTLIACEQLGRMCYMMEYDPKYVDVIIKRWEEYTGKKAEKIV